MIWELEYDHWNSANQYDSLFAAAGGLEHAASAELADAGLGIEL